MKTITLILISFLLATSYLWAQGNNVRIEGQIIGYDGFSTLYYSLSSGNYYLERQAIKPDSLGRFVISESIDNTKFFRFHYRNANEKDIFYACRLIVQPDKNYYIICKSHEDFKTRYSPDIYSLRKQDSDQQTFFKMDFAQMNYNLVDDGTNGPLYHDEWNLYQPDALIETLNQRNNSLISLFSNALKNGEIDKEFFEIAKINVEYVNAYHLAQTIQDIWHQSKKYGIENTLIVNQLINVYSKVFELYPIEGAKLEYVFAPERYIEAYLYYRECFKGGSFSPPKEDHWREKIDDIKPLLSREVYKNYKMQNVLSQTAMLQLHSSSSAKEFLNDHKDLKQSYFGVFLENELIPRAEAFESLSERDLSDEVIFLDENKPILSFKQLLDSLGNKPILVDFWASWCGPCREEMPTIQAIVDKFENSEMEIVLVNTAESGDTVFEFIAAVAPDLDPLVDVDGQVTELWQPRGLPATFFIDPDGKLQYLALGGREWNAPIYLNFLENLIRNK